MRGPPPHPTPTHSFVVRVGSDMGSVLIISSGRVVLRASLELGIWDVGEVRGSGQRGRGGGGAIIPRQYQIVATPTKGVATTFQGGKHPLRRAI